MENLTEKLNTFTALVLKDASQRRDEILVEVKKEREERLSQKETEFLEEAYEEIQDSVSEAKKHSGERVLHEELEAKKQLLAVRESIIEEVMSAAAAELCEFVKSERYETWLTDKIKKSLAEVGKGSKTVYISSDDLKYKDKIEKLEEGKITVEAVLENDFLGGVRIYNSDRRVAVDYSFKEMLRDRRAAFLQSSGLTIN